MQRLIHISLLIVPGLGRNLFSVKQGSRNAVVSIFDKYNPKLKANNFTLPLQELENDLYFFSLDLVSASSAPELTMQAAATATLWHRRMGHLNRKSLDLLKKVNNNGVSFDGTVSDYDVCAVERSRQRAHPKTADQHVQHPFQLVFTDLMGPFTPEAVGGYKYVSKISDEYTRWTEIYLLKSKDGALHALQSFVQSMAIPRGVRVERLRADKGGEFVGNGFKDYCTQTGLLLEYASTNTPQQIGISERVGRTLAAMVRCMLADSGLPMFIWGELIFTAAYVGNRAPHFVLNMQSPYKTLKGTEPDLRILRVIGARAFVHIERRTKKLALKAVEGRLVGHSSNSKSYRVYNTVTRCIIESRNVIFIETPSRPLPPPSEGPQFLMQDLPPGDDPDRDNQGHNYITDDDFLRDLRNYTSVVDYPGSASTDHVTANRRSENTLVAELLGRISAITRRDLLEDGALSGEASPTGELTQGGVLERLEQSTPLQQYGLSRHGVTPAVTRAGNEAFPQGA